MTSTAWAGQTTQVTPVPATAGRAAGGLGPALLPATPPRRSPTQTSPRMSYREGNDCAFGPSITATGAAPSAGGSGKDHVLPLEVLTPPPPGASV